MYKLSLDKIKAFLLFKTVLNSHYVDAKGDRSKLTPQERYISEGGALNYEKQKLAHDLQMIVLLEEIDVALKGIDIRLKNLEGP